MKYLYNTFKLSGLIALSLLLSACNVHRNSDVSNVTNTETSHTGSFVWHDLISDDIDAAQRFYQQLFDWRFVNATGSNGKSYTLIKNNGRYIGGMLQLDDPADGEDYSRWLGYMSVGDIDTALSTTKAKKGTIVIPNQAISGIGQAAAILDPQGAVVGLISSDLEIPENSDPPSTGDIVWNELLTSSPQQATAFYQALSGVDVETISRRGGEYRLLKSNNIKLAGVMQNPSDTGTPVWLTYFSVDDPAASAEMAATLGGKIIIAPTQEIREGTLALIADPSGALLVLEQKDTTNSTGVEQ
jgi:predicted enzyme related to lactoylglutathione lyase